MSPFWTSLFTHLRGCGRNATLFMFALAGCFGVLTLCALACQDEVRRYILPALPWLGLVPILWICFAVRRARARQRQRLLRGPLSDDELHKARAKLVRPKPTPPGTAF